MEKLSCRSTNGTSSGPASMPCRSGLPSAVAAQALLALGRPDFVDLVSRLKCRDTFRQCQPRQLAARIDMDIRADRFRGIECPGTHKQAVTGHDMIAAPQGRAAGLAKEHIVVLAGAAGQSEGLRRHRPRFDKLTLDPDIDHKRAAGLTLAVLTMTGVDDQRALCEPVSDRLARAPT